ncbi:hypothetical protein HDU96_009753 [Phlyctochytrium bullatum]|nr:hypothetical protein HDU96_009753 [Phlyctochytrium bullatum]
MESRPNCPLDTEAVRLARSDTENVLLASARIIRHGILLSVFKGFATWRLGGDEGLEKDSHKFELPDIRRPHLRYATAGGRMSFDGLDDAPFELPRVPDDLFAGLVFFLNPLMGAARVSQLRRLLTDGGGREAPALSETKVPRFDLQRTTHAITHEIDFPEAQILDPTKLIVVTIPRDDMIILFGAIEAFGGQHRLRFTDDVNLLIASTTKTVEYKEAQQRIGVRIVLPHYIDDVARLRRKIDIAAYMFPDPQVLKESPFNTDPPGPPPVPIHTPSEDFLQDQIIFFEPAVEQSLSKEEFAGFVSRIQKGGGKVAASYARNMVTAVVCLNRRTEHYGLAEADFKFVGSLRWITSVLDTGKFTAPRLNVLHYVEFSKYVITTSNYSLDARAAIEEMVKNLGGTFTRQMTKANTHLICAEPFSPKHVKANDWEVIVTNHLWLEESYAEFKVAPLASGPSVVKTEMDSAFPAFQPKPTDSASKGKIGRMKTSPNGSSQGAAATRAGSGETQKRQSPSQVVVVDSDDESKADAKAKPAATKAPLVWSSNQGTAPGKGENPEVRAGIGKTQVSPASAATLSRTSSAATLPNGTTLHSQAPADNAADRKRQKRADEAHAHAPTGNGPTQAKAAPPVREMQKAGAARGAAKAKAATSGAAAAAPAPAATRPKAVTRPLSAAPRSKPAAAAAANGPKPVAPSKPPPEPADTVDDDEPMRTQGSTTQKRKANEMGDTPPRASPRLAVKKQKHTVSVVTTCVTLTDEQWKGIRRLGGVKAKDVDSCTHMITTKIVRTEKFLEAVMQAKEILTPQWIDESISAECWLDPAPFRLKDVAGERIYDFKLQTSLERSKERGVFEGYTLYLTPRVDPAFEVQKRFIETGGGKAVKMSRRDLQDLQRRHQGETLPPPTDAGTPTSSHHYDPEKTIYVVSDQDEDFVKRLEKLGIPLYLNELVLRACLRQEISFVDPNCRYVSPKPEGVGQE